MSERNTPHDANESSTQQSAGRKPSATRRSVLKAAAVGAAGLTVGASAVGSGSASNIPTPPLTRCGNKLLDPTGSEVILRGTNIADPGRQTRKWRAQTADETVELALDTEAEPPSGSEIGGDVTGWHNDIIRIPTQPQDILAGETQGEGWEPWTKMPHGDDWGPALPGDHGSGDPITEDILDTYFTAHVDPLVDMCEEKGAYAMIDYHRHMPIFHQVQLPWDELVGTSGNAYRCGDAISSSKDWENDQGGCGERGVLWHGADQVEEIENNIPLVYQETDRSPWFDQVAEALHEEIQTYWEYVADKYADRDHVIFDVYNEPTGPYEGDWGSPTRQPPGGDEGGDGTPSENPFWWDLWVDRAQPWVDTVEENAPGSVVTIGSPRWSQYTHHAGVTSEFDHDSIQMCYTAHIYMQEGFDVQAQYGPAAQEVPVFFSEFGWAEGGGMDEFGFLAGTTDEGKERFDPFIADNPVHPLGWCFDHTWEPFFFTHEDAKIQSGTDPGNWMQFIEPWDRRPGQWWMKHAYENRDVKKPSDGEGTPVCPDDPTDTGPTDTGPTDTGDLPPVGDHENAPTDPDDDGQYEDLTGNGQKDPADVVTLFEEKNSPEVQDHVSAYDFSGNGAIEVADVVDLFGEI